MAKRKRKTVTQQIMQEAIKILNKHQHDLTRQQYIRDFKRFVKYCREKHNCRNLRECKKYIQEYVDYLTDEKQLSASTVHTYLASICSVYNIKLSTSHEKQITAVNENMFMWTNDLYGIIFLQV